MLAGRGGNYFFPMAVEFYWFKQNGEILQTVTPALIAQLS